MVWRELKGYYYRYRINEEGEVQRFWPGKQEWRTKKAYKSGSKYWTGKRLCVKLTKTKHVYQEVAIVDLMADAFMGGRAAHPNQVLVHKNGSSHDCSLRNLKWVSRQEAGRISGGSRRKAVLKIDANGEVVHIYKSMSECARKEYITRATIYRMIKKRVTAERSCTGFAYAFDK